MSIIKHIKRITYINYLISKKSTGSLENFAQKNNISTRTLSEILCDMKELGFPIKFDRNKNSYIYTEEGEMVKNLFLKYGEVLNRQELKIIGKDDELCFSEKAIFVPCNNSENNL